MLMERDMSNTGQREVMGSIRLMFATIHTLTWPPKAVWTQMVEAEPLSCKKNVFITRGERCSITLVVINTPQVQDRCSLSKALRLNGHRFVYINVIFTADNVWRNGLFK